MIPCHDLSKPVQRHGLILQILADQRKRVGVERRENRLSANLKSRHLSAIIKIIIMRMNPFEILTKKGLFFQEERT